MCVGVGPRMALVTICVKREIREGQFSPFTVILSEKLVNFRVISSEIPEITLMGREQELTT